jgi:hypothetical protein
MIRDINISDEQKLLIDLCRMEFSNEQAGRIKDVISLIKDWQYFADHANKHGVGALVYNNLDKLGFLEYLPKSDYGFLRNVMMMSLARNTRHISEMKGILNILNKAGIKTVLLKGLALETTVYENKGLRQMTDVDVLISGNDCIKSRNLLLANGFESLPVKSPLHKLIIMHTGKHLPSLIKGEFSIEIHHDLFGKGKEYLTQMLFDKSHSMELNGERAFIPPAQLFFLYLVKHLSYHEMNNESQLRLYADLVVLVEFYREEILNTDLIELADRAGIKGIIAGKLELLGEFWGLDFPDWIGSFIRECHSAAVAEKFIFFLGSPKDNPVTGRVLTYRHTLREIPGFHRKMLFVLGDLFPSIQFMKKRYKCKSGIKALLYYPHRLGKLWYILK